MIEIFFLRKIVNVSEEALRLSRLKRLAAVFGINEARERIIAMDGDKCCGIFWCMPDDYTIEPYIRLAAGGHPTRCVPAMCHRT